MHRLDSLPVEGALRSSRCTYWRKLSSLAVCQAARFNQRGDDSVAILEVRVQPPAAWMWYTQHGQVNGESRAVPAFLRLAPTEDHNLQLGQKRHQLDERWSRFVEVGRSHLADLVLVADIPRHDVPVDDI